MSELPENGQGKVAVIIVAAGRGERAGKDDGPKQYRLIGGRPVISHTLDAFLANPRVDRIVVAIHPDDGSLFDRAAPRDARILAVHGGATRQASTLKALEALTQDAPDIVLIHDAVRPFVSQTVQDAVIEAVDEAQGALPALPVSDTLKRGADGVVAGTVDRDGLYAAQTPQGFPYRPLLNAHRLARNAGRADFTDDASIAEWAGLAVRLVPGSPDNFKITWARDIIMADQKLATGTGTFFPDVRTGNGYDVHGFEPGDHVMLCGVRVAHGQKLSGHSDADVGLHALTDALLATCSAGDIGTHFPPSDPQWKGMASHVFVEHAAKLVRGYGARIASVDVTLICEAPRVGPHRAAMTAAMAGMLKISPDRISIKATTNEKLGFIGREEGIAAIATATVIYPGEVPA